MGLIRTTETRGDDLINEDEENEFEVIPHRARIALTARFARRTVSSFGTRWPDVPTYGSEKYLQAIKQVEEFAAFAEPVSDIETLRNEVIMSLGAIRRSIYDRDDDSIPTVEEEQFVVQADEATRIVELALEISQSSPAESAGIIRIVYHRFMLLFTDLDNDFCESMLEDLEKLCAFSMIEKWADNTLVAPQIFDKDLPAVEEKKSGPEKLVDLMDSTISSRWFYGIFFIALASWSQFKIAPELNETLWYGVTTFDISWAILGVLILARSRWAIGMYVFSSVLLGLFAIYFGLVDAFTTNRIILLFVSLFLLYRYRDVVDAVKK